jgi:diadenosine tetraphosphate (Ap4A) HIT family hydrolase
VSQSPLCGLASRVPQCDDSGLCEIVDRSRLPRVVDRCLDGDRAAVLLADVSPVRVGHCLVLPREHVTSTLALATSTNESVWALAHGAAHRLRDLCGTPVVLLEHGLSPTHLGPSCVRHAHVHVCPIDLPGELDAVLDRLFRQLRFASTREEVESHAAHYDSHVIGHCGSSWFSGIPDPRVRQVTRVFLSSLVATPPVDIDWIFGAFGAKYLETLELFSQDSRDRTPSMRGRSRD